MSIKQKIIDWWDDTRSLLNDILASDEQEKTPIISVMVYRERLKKYKMKSVVRTTLIVGVVAAAAFGTKYVIDHWEYKDYKVITEYYQEEASTVKYTEMANNILKYGGDEVSLLNRQNTVMWNSPQTMDNPEVDVCQQYCVVYDKKGTKMSIFNQNGKVGDIQTELPVTKAKVASQGVVAAVLEDKDTTWINLYDAQGNEIATVKTRIDSPGFPVDLELSDDGLLLAVSYLKVEDYKPASYVAFYNFGTTGRNQMDNLVSAYTYAGVIIPDIEYMDDSRFVAIMDDGFVVYKGNQIPEEECTVNTEEEIISVFFDEDAVGMVFRGDDDEPYRMDLYKLNGKLKWSAGIEIAFDEITVSGERILLYSKNEFAIYTMKGICRYKGALQEGNLREIFKIAGNRYLMIMNEGNQTIKLS